MGILSWIIFGAFSGWVASIIVGNRSSQGCLGNIIVGVVGALIGGAVVGFLRGGDRMTLANFGWDWYSFGVAVIGAVLLLFVTGARRR